MVSFKDAVRICLREKYVTFSGRAPRSEFWWFQLFTCLFPVILVILGFVLFYRNIGTDPNTGLIAPTFPGTSITLFVLAGIIILALMIPVISVTVRRFHDRNLSGWWVLAVYVVPNIFSVIGTEIPGILIGIASFVVCVLKGTDGPNKYGPDPLKPAADADVFA